MALEGGQDQGGQLVWKRDDDTIVPVRILIDSDGNEIVIGFNNGINDTPIFFEDTNFVSGDSPAVLDINQALGRNGTRGTIINDGDGDFTVSFSNNGNVWGDEIRIETQEQIDFEGISVDSLRITHVSDSSYRVLVI